jgi:small subunit ribosomal protein S16
MSIVIRMSRQGRTNRPHFRIGVYDVRTRRDGPPIEYLGHYDPYPADDAAKVTLNAERVQYWLGQGADVSDTVASFLRRRGIPMPKRAGNKPANAKRRKTKGAKRVKKLRARQQAAKAATKAG